MTVAQRATAHRMIAAKGQAVTITRRAAGAYNTATGAAAITETVQTGMGVIFDFAPGLRKMAGGNIPDTDRQCLLSAQGITAPKVDDFLTDANSAEYLVTAVSPLAPAGLVIMYELTIRGHA